MKWNVYVIERLSLNADLVGVDMDSADAMDLADSADSTDSADLADFTDSFYSTDSLSYL